MFGWVPYAMVRAALFFVGGILLAIYQPDLFSQQAATGSCVALAALFAVMYSFRKKFRLPASLGFVGLAFMLLAGYLHLHHATESKRNHHLIHFSACKAYVAIVSSAASERDNSWRLTLEVERVYEEDKWRPASGRLYFYWPKRLGVVGLFYGDRVLIRGTPTEMEPPGNPGEFDYKRFLTFRNIYHQHFYGGDGMAVLARATRKNVVYYSLVAREWAQRQLSTYVRGEREQAIAMALTLGVTDGIDNELQGAYASSGAMHVLAVSGLHVGILYAIVAFLLRPLRDTAKGQWVVAAVSLVILWSFAFVTGLSPSVQRAVMMFSFVALGRALGRGTNIYNTLAASAFVLLLFDPFLIMSVGFQLSYLAVIGIVTLHRPLYLLWEPTSVALDWIWSITCIAIAAQLSTFALGLLYFHQFPVYFMVSNLFVIPGATVILILSISVIAMSFVPLVAMGLGALLRFCIKVVNTGVFAVESLPFSLIEGINISTLQAWLLIGIVSFVYLLFLLRQFRYLIIATGCALAFSAIQWKQYITYKSDHLFVVYNVRGHAAMEWMTGGHSVFLTDSSLVQDDERIRFHIRPLRLRKGIACVETKILAHRVLSWRHGQLRVAYIGEPNPPIVQPLEVDFLIVGNNAFKHYDEIASLVRFKELILDGTNADWISKRIREEATGQSLVHSVIHQGAYVHKF